MRGFENRRVSMLATVTGTSAGIAGVMLFARLGPLADRAMPGAKKQRNPIGIPARPAIALELLQPAAACVGAAIAWPTAVAVAVVVAALAACVLQGQRWRWMLARRAT